jgi:hypothetical protein
MEQDMDSKDAKQGAVATAVSQAKFAFANGKLSQYVPLVASGADETKSVCPASWGPSNRT